MVSHAHQGPQREWQVQQGDDTGEGKSRAELGSKKCWRDRPHSVKEQERREHSPELRAQAPLVKRHRREQIQARGNAHHGRHQQYPDYRTGARGEVRSEDKVHRFNFGQGEEIEA